MIKNIFNFLKGRILEVSSLTGGFNVAMALEYIPDPTTKALFVILGGVSILLPEKFEKVMELITSKIKKN